MVQQVVVHQRDGAQRQVGRGDWRGVCRTVRQFGAKGERVGSFIGRSPLGRAFALRVKPRS